MDWSLPVHGGRYEKTDIRGQQCGQAADLHCTQGADDPETPEQDHRAGALVSIVEAWLLGEIQGTPEELIRFVDQVLRDHVRGAGLRLSQAGPGTAPLLEPDHCAGPVSK